MKRKIVIYLFIIFISIIFGDLVYSSGNSISISVTSPYKEEYKVEKEEDKLDEETVKNKYIENEKEEKKYIIETKKENNYKFKEYNNVDYKNNSTGKIQYLPILNFILIILLFYLNLFKFKIQNKD